MIEFEAAGLWIESHEALLSGMAAATFLATLAVAPFSATTRALRSAKLNAAAGAETSVELPRLSTDLLFERPAVAVLPFVDQGDDPDRAYFAAGITEDLMTALSGMRCFPVIGRSSIEATLEQESDPRRVGLALGARYLISGTVRREDDQVRISARLVDAENGRTLWAQAFDRTFARILELQDAISHAIAGAIEPRLERAEERRALALPVEKLDAWDSSLRALWHVRKGGREDLDEAHRLLEWALVRDPNSSNAHSVLALCRFQQALLGWKHDPGKALAGTLRAARAAVALDDEDWLAHTLLGIASLWTLRDYERALEEQDRALELNPSAALSHQFRACVQLFAGHPEDAVRSLERVLRLEPRYQSRSMILADLALNHLIMGDAEKAAEFARRAIDDAPGNVRAHQRLVAALGHRGDAVVTEAALKDLLSLQPDVCVEGLAATYPFRRERDWKVFSEGLREAGVPATR